MPEATVTTTQEQIGSEKKTKGKDYACWRQFNIKPSIIPGCPGRLEVPWELTVVTCAGDNCVQAAIQDSFMQINPSRGLVCRHSMLCQTLFCF